ncbi:hypothetical protein C8Q70DRAFT_135699 [Cubamyces menziesii]|nr:hypothetical protein C8Q70DRAFT_135699 [Cubamyces menziesii]
MLTWLLLTLRGGCECGEWRLSGQRRVGLLSSSQLICADRGWRMRLDEIRCSLLHTGESCCDRLGAGIYGTPRDIVDNRDYSLLLNHLGVTPESSRRG